MDPLQGWTLVAFVSVMIAALLLLELGMRRARGAQPKGLPAEPARRGRGSRS